MTPSVEIRDLFWSQAQEIMATATDFDERARPILEQLADLSAQAASARLSGLVWEAVEESIASALQRLEVAGMLAIANEWRTRTLNILSGVAQGLLRVALPPLSALGGV